MTNLTRQQRDRVGRALIAAYSRALRPLLFRAYGGDPEKIHELTIKVLGRIGVTPLKDVIAALVPAACQPVEVAGVHFPGRVGLAAGVDKDGLAAPCWSAFGFGFAELGTVTAAAQPGNPTPRLYRLKRSQALINRMGFNNRGAQALAERLGVWGVERGNQALDLTIGISLGKTKVTPLDQAIEDYRTSLKAVAPRADYIALNVSSPNTPGLRRLQDGRTLTDLLTALVAEAPDLPLFVKLSPDLTSAQLDATVEAAERGGARGLIATNTTLRRGGLVFPETGWAFQAGGLSGAPLQRRALAVVGQVVRSTTLPVIGSGGVMTPDDAHALFDAGAQLVQVCTGFIFSGPGLVTRINALDR